MMTKINEVIEGLNIAVVMDLRAKDYINSCFLKEDGTATEEYKYKAIEKKKYIYLDCGGSGVFMIDRDGEIFNIKSYGTIDKNKKLKADLGNIKDYNTMEDFKRLNSLRYNYLR